MLVDKSGLNFTDVSDGLAARTRRQKHVLPQNGHI